ncbi:MAG TPA: aminotransferase class III-fold pyridoxal phosphate-dependent enzyme, partial [Brumimicrobium sp.]|nr:aminotransferase class III-fold pyridoxal phosphate-dependent enzyme [Brumimicrobium sp.]
GHISTFAGHPVICAAGAATLKILSEIDYKSIEIVGKYIEVELLKHPLVKEIRRIGMMFAIDMENAEIVNKIVSESMNRGVLSYWFLSHPESFRLSPPLTLTLEEAKEGVDIILGVMNEI